MAAKFTGRSLYLFQHFFKKPKCSVNYSMTPGCKSPRNRKFCVAGNWKMYGDRGSISKLCNMLYKADLDTAVDKVVACPAVYLPFVRSRLPATIEIAAENVYKVPEGAFTGEISPAMLNDLSIQWALLGQSERRLIFRESDEFIAEKCKHALDEGLNVIACVGETLKERDGRKSEEVVARQLLALATKIKDWKNVVLAYEPVWAIGTGKAITPEQIQEMHYFIRNWLRKRVSVEVSDKTRIQYGGPVNCKNCKRLTELHDVDGFLVGGPSLQPDFIDIINCKK